MSGELSFSFYVNLGGGGAPIKKAEIIRPPYLSIYFLGRNSLHCPEWWEAKSKTRSEKYINIINKQYLLTKWHCTASRVQFNNLRSAFFFFRRFFGYLEIIRHASANYLFPIPGP